MSDTREIKFTTSELDLLAEALDSHVYWQLSDEHYRNNGFVNEPGSDDPDAAAEIVEAEKLINRIRGIR